MTSARGGRKRGDVPGWRLDIERPFAIWLPCKVLQVVKSDLGVKRLGVPQTR